YLGNRNAPAEVNSATSWSTIADTHLDAGAGIGSVNCINSKLITSKLILPEPLCKGIVRMAVPGTRLPSLSLAHAVIEPLSPMYVYSTVTFICVSETSSTLQRLISGVRSDRSPRKPVNIGQSWRLSSYSTENSCNVVNLVSFRGRRAIRSNITAAPFTKIEIPHKR